jgi:hypothetical protein
MTGRHDGAAVVTIANLPARLAEELRGRASMAAGIAHARVVGRRRRAEFDGVRVYCMFIGYPRSGHSLVGSLIDAHPDAVISHELDALRYVQTGLVGRDELYTLILRRDAAFTAGGRTWTGYDYSIPNQWQGRHERLLVIGDKRGGDSTWRLRRHPELLDRLERMVEVDVRLVHVVRNPFDNISTMHRRSGDPLAKCADRYFTLCDTNASIRSRWIGSVIDVRHETMISDPTGSLRRLIDFLGLEPTDAYIRDCSSTIFPSPNTTRSSVEWPKRLVTEIQRRVDEVEFLAGYTFDG